METGAVHRAAALSCDAGVRCSAGARGQQPRAERASSATRARAATISLASGARLPSVARLGGEPPVFDRCADGEVIQALECMTAQAEDVVHRVVVEAADAGAAHTGGLRGKIQRLSDEPRLPEQMAVEAGPERVQAGVEVGNHRDAEVTVTGDVLVAADTARQRAAVAP